MSVPLKAPTTTVAAHSDSNTQGLNVYLNKRVIKGLTTNVCVSDSALDSIVTDAIALWNSGTDDHLDFNLFTRTNLCSNAQIEIVSATYALPIQGITDELNCGSDSRFMPSNSKGTWACFDANWPKMTNPDWPRYPFESRFDPTRGRALIIYQALPGRTATNDQHVYVMAHELGHVAGLAHYANSEDVGASRCDRLRIPPPSETPGLYAANDVDRDDDDYTIMTGPRAACASNKLTPGGIITGRDLRDFFEAYQPGALTGVAAALTVNDGRLDTLQFSWTEAGMSELKHNSDHIAILGRYPNSAADPDDREWKELKTIDVVDDDGTLMTLLTINEDTTTDSPPLHRREYKIVGLTRAGVRVVNGEAWAELLPTGANRTSTLASGSWVMGDPVHVFGDLWSSPGPKLYFAGSFSRAAGCYVSGSQATGTLPFVWRLGSNDPQRSFSTPVTYTLQFNGSDAFDEAGLGATGAERDVLCRDLPAGSSINRTLAVLATVTGGNALNQPAVTGEVRVQVRNHDTPLRVLSVSVQQEDGFVVTPGSDAHADTVAVNCSRRMPGVFRWNVVGGVEPIAVWLTPVERWMPSSLWASGYTGNTVTIRCPTQGRTRAELGVFALGADGSGVAARAGDFQIVAEGAPEPPTNVRVLSTTQRRLRVAWDLVSGATAYQASVRVEGAKSETTDGNTTSVWVWAPHAGTEYVAQVRARDARGVWSAWTPALGTSQAPSLAPPPDVWVSETTSDSITVTWDTITGIPFYGVWCCDMMMPVNEPGFLWLPSGTTLTQSHTFEGLTTDKEYTVSVRSRSGFDSTSPWVELDPVCIGSCDDD